MPTGALSGIDNAVELVAGEHHACARKTDDTIWCWGNNDYGQLGDGSTTIRSTPVELTTISDLAEISLGTTFTCERKTDGTVWCWGKGYNAQLGDGLRRQVLGAADPPFEDQLGLEAVPLPQEMLHRDHRAESVRIGMPVRAQHELSARRQRSAESIDVGPGHRMPCAARASRASARAAPG